VGLFLPPPQDSLLGMENSSDDLAILFDLSNFLLNFFLASIILPLEASLGKGLLFGFGPLFWGKNKHIKK